MIFSILINGTLILFLQRITATSPLRGLEGFDPKTEYGPDTYKGRTVKAMRNTQTEMGKISNLITDMTLKGATEDEDRR